jgi:hypothetical protein
MFLVFNIWAVLPGLVSPNIFMSRAGKLGYTLYLFAKSKKDATSIPTAEI